MSFTILIAVWISVATVLVGFAFVFLLQRRRQRRLAAESRRRALEALTQEQQRVARLWGERDHEPARAVATATEGTVTEEAYPTGHLEEAHATLASVAVEDEPLRQVLVELEQECIPITAVIAPATANIRAVPREAPAPAAPAAPAVRERRGGEAHPVRFQVLWHGSMSRQESCPLLAYMYSGWDGFSLARADFRHRANGSAEQYPGSAATDGAEGGVPITIIPEMEGFVFSPPAARVHWLEPWQRVEFRVRASASLEPLGRTGSVRGRVAFFVGPILVAETAIAVATDAAGESTLQPSRDPPNPGAIWKEISRPAYGCSFVSHSRADTFIVEQLEEAQRAIGNSHLRDVTILRSGEGWHPAFLRNIARADIFQLCWSRAAKDSPYVEQEWQCALGMNRRGFVRPMYWELPMPEPPEPLRHLHFTFVDMYS